MGSSLINEINLLKTNGIFQKGLIQLSQDSPLYILRGNYNNYNEFLSLKINFTLSIKGDPDEMLHNAAFHPGLLC